MSGLKMTRGNTNDPIWFDKRKGKNIYFMQKKREKAVENQAFLTLMI